MRIEPKCRVCDAPVEFFGELCHADRGWEPDGWDEIVRADTARLNERYDQ